MIEDPPLLTIRSDFARPAAEAVAALGATPSGHLQPAARRCAERLDEGRTRSRSLFSAVLLEYKGVPECGANECDKPRRESLR